MWSVLHVQAKKKKKEEAANAKLLEAEKRIKVSLAELQNQECVIVNNLRWCIKAVTLEDCLIVKL